MMAGKVTRRGPQWQSLGFYMEFYGVISGFVSMGTLHYNGWTSPLQSL